MLLKSKEIIQVVPEGLPANPVSEEKEPALVIGHNDEGTFIADPENSLITAIGTILPGRSHHYYSWGNFNLVRLITHLIRQTGPVHLMMTSYSFSRKSIEQIQNRIDRGDILSFRVILDNRVRVMSPKPFQMIMTSFDYRCTSVHAKVALLWNDHWKLTIITSQNATDNPKLERGIIFTDPDVFNFDLKILEHEFDNGTT